MDQQRKSGDTNQMICPPWNFSLGILTASAEPGVNRKDFPTPEIPKRVSAKELTSGLWPTKRMASELELSLRRGQILK